MKYLSPIALTDAQVTASSVPETPPAAYAGGTTYAAGTTASTGTAGGVITVWESLQNGNVDHTPASSPTWWKNLGTTYAAHDLGAAYAADAIVLSAASHRLYKSVQGGNVNHALTETSWWVDIGPTNRWAMFDRAVGSVTRAPSPLVITITPGEVFNGIVLADLVASSVQVAVVVDAVTIYDQTFAMEDRRPCAGWWDWLFLPLDSQTGLVVENLPPAGVVTITINGATEAACGTFAIGRIVSLGETLAAPEIGIKDYSIKETDAYGITTVLERGYAKTASFRVGIDGNRVDAVARQLAGQRATPTIWIGDDQQRYNSLLIYGFFVAFSVVITYPTHSECRLTIEGLST